MKKYCGLILLLAICMPVFAEDIIIGAPSSMCSCSKNASQSDTKAIFKGQSQDEIIANYGEPTIKKNMPDGTEIWLYDKVSSVTYLGPAGTGLITSANSSNINLNRQIATNAFGKGFWGQTQIETQMETQPVYTTDSIKIIFDKQNRVIDYSYDRENF